MTLGANIANYRKKLDLTQDALAQKLGVTNQAVSKWETEQTCPDIQLLPQLADIFGITLDELFGRDEPQTGRKTEFDFENVFGVSLEELEKRGNQKKRQTGTTCTETDWPDDGVLRVVVYEGQRLICGGEAKKDFCVELCKDVQEILSTISVSCGDVEGSVYANGNVNCGDVDGDVDAGASVACGDVNGDVDAGANVACGDVDGDVDAGASVTCGNVGGDVDAGTSVTCGNVEGSVDAGCEVHIG